MRSFEAFKYLHVGMISDIKRKTLPAISRVVGLSNEQGLLHFLTESPWKSEQLREARLQLILQVLSGRETVLIIDETGDRKKGETTDYVKRQYIGNLEKIENGISLFCHFPKSISTRSILSSRRIKEFELIHCIN